MKFVIDNMLIMVLLTFVICIGGTVLLYTTGYLNRIFDWLKPDSSKNIPVKLFCEDGQIRDRKMEVGRYVISDHKLRRSFYLVHRLQLIGAAGRATFLALTERSARPIDFRSTMKPEDWKRFPTAQNVFIDTTADIKSEAAKEATGNFLMRSLTIMALSVAVVVVVMGIILFIQSRGG